MTVGSPPQHVRLRESILERISSRHYVPGQQIPTRSQIMREYGYARVTVDRAIQDLISSGYLEGKRGSGTYVLDRENPPVAGQVVHLILKQHQAARPTETSLFPLIDRLSHSGYKVQLSSIDDVFLAPDQFVKTAHAAIFCQLDPRYIDTAELFVRAGRPVLLVNRDDARFDTVTNDSFAGIHRVLVDNNVQRVGIIAESPAIDRPYCNTYIGNFYKAVAMHRAIETRAEWFLTCDRRRLEASVPQLLDLFRDGQRPDTFFISGYALPYVVAAIHTVGLKLGRDVRLFHFDRMPDADDRPGVISMVQDYRCMAEHVLQWLAHLDDPQRSPFHVKVAPVLMGSF